LAGQRSRVHGKKARELKAEQSLAGPFGAHTNGGDSVEGVVPLYGGVDFVLERPKNWGGRCNSRRAVGTPNIVEIRSVGLLGLAEHFGLATGFVVDKVEPAGLRTTEGRHEVSTRSF
jgi:hypothetical protein